MALIVRYDTRIRVFASYGCTIKIGYAEATVTGAGFFHGGVSIKPEADCSVGAYIDIIPEDWRLLSSGKKRLVFDHTCGIIPLCPGPNAPPPQLPAPAHPPPNPSPSPSPPPFPPGTVNLPPATPRFASPSLPPGVLPPTVELGSTSMALLALGMAGLCGFGCLQLYFMAWFRRSAAAARSKFAEATMAVPVAKIDEDGKTSIVTGVAVVRGTNGINSINGMKGKGRARDMERESLLSGPRY
jgi:hypothetical protein